MTTESISFLRCIEQRCSASYSIKEKIYSCPSCGGLLDVAYDFHVADIAEMKAVFNARLSSDDAADRSGVWRYRELLPFAHSSHIVTLQEGNTPVYDAPRSSDYAALDALRFKHQGMNPTGSFKDNGMTTGVTQARALGASAVACASTGNTSASMAAYAARARMQAFVFIPAGQVAYGKLSQSLEYGSKVIQIEGNFDDAMRLVREITEETSVYLLNSINPFRLEGQKAIIIEMMEQLRWSAPDWIVVPGGNLGNSSSFGKALCELYDLGFIDRMPRLAVIQAEGAAPFYDLFISSDKSAIRTIDYPATLATAIKIGSPVSWKKALRAISWTDGVVERVSEQEIADAKAVIGRDGLGCEPASAATLAGAKKLVAEGVIDRSANVIAVLTGNLMKDASYTVDYHTDALTFEGHPIKSRFANRPATVAADKKAIRRLLDL
ncbi:MAG: threonine synthase [Acidobacteriota bacterium]